MVNRLKSLNFYVLVALDLGLILAAHLLAYELRFEASVPPEHWARMISLMPAAALIKLGCFFAFDLYKGMWRYTSLPDLMNIVKAVTTASVVIVVWLLLSQASYGYSRSVLLLDWVFTCLMVGGLRLGIRMVYGVGMISLPSYLLSGRRKARKAVVLLGAGKTGEKLVRELMDAPDADMGIAAIFDDDPALRGRILHGLPIVGPVKSLPQWIERTGDEIREALIAMPSAEGEQMRAVVEHCEAAGLPYRRIPGLGELARGEISIKNLRDVDYKDLLGRDPADLDMDSIAGYLTGKTVLVTGAGGSIGSELCRQILPFKPKKLLILDLSEYALYTIQMELEHERGFTDYEPLLGTLTDKAWTDWVLDVHRPDVIFHAAAYKHVPMLEVNPWQAVYNNIQPTAHLVSAAVARGVERLLVVSTDKAVRPTNVMGASKRFTERIMQAHCGMGTRLMAVRFGNVIGSAGSVIPLFRRQIERGGPLTVTHPDVTRYFMTIEESCRLILQAGSMGGDGELFVLKMGKPVRIADMAKDLIRLSGKVPDRDVKIKFIGMRPGEKLFEELITEDEGVVPTDHSQIMVLKGHACGWDELTELMGLLGEAADARDHTAIRDLLRRGVPEFTPDGDGSR